VRSTRWGLAACWSKAGRSASISSDVRERDQTSEKSLTLIEIGLTAAIVAIKGNEPLILAASGSDPDKLAGLPLGPFEAEIRLRAWVEKQPGCGFALTGSSIVEIPPRAI